MAVTSRTHVLALASAQGEIERRSRQWIGEMGCNQAKEASGFVLCGLCQDLTEQAQLLLYTHLKDVLRADLSGCMIRGIRNAFFFVIVGGWSLSGEEHSEIARRSLRLYLGTSWNVCLV
jgi:hypothetical protein